MTTRRFAPAIALTLGVLAATVPTAASAFYVSVDMPHHPQEMGGDLHRWGSFAPNVPIESGGSLLSTRGRANCMHVAEPPPNASPPTASVDVTVEAQDAE